MEKFGIVFITDRGFFVPTVVAITSLLENRNSETCYHIYLIQTFDQEGYRKIIDRISKKYGCDIEIIVVEENYIEKTYGEIVTHKCNATHTALLKFDIPNLCKNEKRVLYLDGDIVVRHDLGEIFRREFEPGKCIQAVLDSGGIYSTDNQFDYFNSGFIFMDLDYMRSHGISEKLFMRKREDDDISLMDQNVFNQVLRDHLMVLPHRFNIMYPNLVRAKYFKSISISMVNAFFDTCYSDFEDIFESASVVHYASFEKPWLYSDTVKVSLWEQYYKMTEVGNIKLKRKKMHLNLIFSLGIVGKIIWTIEKKFKNTENEAFENIEF